LGEIAVKIGHVGVDRFRAPRRGHNENAAMTATERHFWHRARVLLHEPEMVEHGMAGERAELADNAQHHRLRIDPLEPDLALAEIGLDTVKSAKEVVIPERTAEFAVR
jgi:hypothetical protein